METKNRNICVIAAIVLSMFGLSVAFASISTAIKISGSSYLKTASWDISFQTPTNIVNGGNGGFLDNPVGGNVEGVPTVAGSTIYFQAELFTPNDYIKFDVPIKNNGTIDATLDQIIKNIEGTDSELIEILVTDQNGEELSNQVSLNKEETIIATITLKYKDGVQSVPSGEEISIGITFLWVQK